METGSSHDDAEKHLMGKLIFGLLGGLLVVGLSYYVYLESQPVDEGGEFAQDPVETGHHPFEMGDILTANSEDEQVDIVMKHFESLASKRDWDSVGKWMKKLSDTLLGETEQERAMKVLTFEKALQGNAGRGRFDPGIKKEPTVEDEQAIAEVRLAIRVFDQLISRDELSLLAISHMEALGAPFNRHVLEGDRKALRRRLEQLMTDLNELQIEQLLTMGGKLSRDFESIIKSKYLLWAKPVAQKDPVTAGHLMAHLFDLCDQASKNNSRSGYTAIKTVGQMIVEDGGVVALGKFLGAVVKAVPDYPKSMDSNYEELICDAWRAEIKNNLPADKQMDKADWMAVYDHAFLITGTQLSLPERSLLALGLRSCLITHFDTFSYDVVGSGAMPERLIMKRLLSKKLKPYPEFRVCALLCYSAHRHDYKEESHIGSKELMSFVVDENYPFYVRFQVGYDSLRVKFRIENEADARPGAYGSLLCEFARSGHHWDQIEALNLLRYIRGVAQKSKGDSAWASACSQITKAWLKEYFVPSEVFKLHDSSVLNELMLAAVASGDLGLVTKMVHDHKAVMQGNVGLIEQLMLAGREDLAVQLCSSSSNRNRAYHYSKFNATKEQKIPGLLKKIRNKEMRYMMEIMLMGARDEEQNNRPEVARIERLRSLAVRYDHTVFSNQKAKMDCLKVLCSEPSVAYLLRFELERELGGLEIADFKRGSKLLERRGIACFEGMLLFNSYLGNKLRDGDIQYVEYFIQELINESRKGLDHGAWMLGDFLRVFYDHALVMVEAGSTAKIGKCRHMSRDIYQFMITNHKGYNYQSQAMAVNDFCHAAAKKFNEIKPWVDGLSDKAKKYHYGHRVYLGAKPISSPSPFINLAVFDKLRGGWSREECAPLRRSGALMLMEDPALMKLVAPKNFLSYCPRYMRNSAYVLSNDDVFAVLDAWAARYPEHEGYPYEDLRTISWALKDAAKKRDVKRTSQLQVRKARVLIVLGKVEEAQALLRSIRKEDCDPEVWKTRQSRLIE